MTDDKVLTQKQAAAMLGVSTRRLRQRDQEDNPPPKTTAGQYPCQAFAKWLQDEWRRSMGITEDGTRYDYDLENSRLRHHQANVAEMDEKQKRRELILAEEVASAWTNIVANARAKLLSLPSRLGSVCGMKPSADVQSEAQSIIYESLNELAAGGNDGLKPE